MHTQPGNARNRTNSLRRVKDSTEVLRHKSVKKDGPTEGAPGPREGKQYTVGTVGSNGWLYLRPAENKTTHATQHTHQQHPLTPPKSAPILIEHDEVPAWPSAEQSADTQYTSAPTAVSLKRSVTSAKKSLDKPRVRQVRARSFSSVDERASVSGPSTLLKIVIDRSPVIDELPPDALNLPTLQVPIPHYKLGTPRFSTHGTPMLRNSAYSRSSAAVSDTLGTSNLSQRDFVFPAPPGTTHPDPMSLGVPKTLHGDDGSITPRSSVWPGSVAARVSQPITPALFDELARFKDDPSVVRYARQTQSIVAATPARIVAQISSESFMDYDLVSDFFLTFRSYMSTSILLDLLMARLRWAVGRLEEDGRIIRIRTFAAIRHWILNYFPDDFVPNRDLRLQYCELLNRIYNEVRLRTTSTRSDLKILQDLKRCWNGRCSMYWDSPYFAMDVNLDGDIIPGGAAETRAYEPDLPFPTPPIPKPPEVPSQSHGPSRISGRIPKFPAPHTPGRSRVEISAVLPSSPESELGLQPNSCSFPVTVPRWTGAPPRESGTPSLPSVQMRRNKAPANLAVQVNGHRRSARSIDSDREPTPTFGDPLEFAKLHAGSFIRGHVYPPASAIVQVLSSSSLGGPSNFDLYGSAQSNVKSAVHINPATRSLFGSLRRALGARQGGQDITMLAMSNNQHPASVRGRIWTKPLSVTRSQDELRKKVDSRPVKTHLRVDFLCAAVGETYEAVRVAAKAKRSDLREPQTALLSGKQHSFLNPPTPPMAKAERLLSQATAQSGSILIVDDTGLDLPAMSGALPAGIPRDTNVNDNPALAQDTISAMRHPIPKRQVVSQEVISADEIGSNPRGISLAPSKAGVPRSSTMRRPETPSKPRVTNGPGPSLDDSRPLEETDAEDQKHDSPIRVPAQSLRRRPGGNLKDTRHVHDLETSQSQDSADAAATDDESLTESLVIMSNRDSQEELPLPPGRRRVSMINTHSSQHLRPSFQAAVSGFSAIPDDDDGGLEATMMKLEGKYEKSPVLDQQEQTPNSNDLDRSSELSEEPEGKKQHRQEHAQEDAHVQSDEPDTVLPARGSSSTAHRIPRGLGLAGLRESKYQSVDSKSQLPLLERNLPGESVTERRLVGPSANTSPNVSAGSQNSHPSIEVVHKTASMEDLHRPLQDVNVAPSSSDRSFLLDENEAFSDLSSEISVDIINQADIIGRPFSPMVAAPGTARSGLDLPSHPLGHTSDISSNVKPSEPSVAANGKLLERLPLTPEPSPIQEHMRYRQQGSQLQCGSENRSTPIPSYPSTAHIPFVLACDSQTLAQQLTLVEREALNEVEWLDLVEMRWDNKSIGVCDWAEYLSTTKHAGVDLVVTRFNLMVKWVLSEIVLTQNIHERARTVSKYVHTAAHARRLHNYSTMLQITIALTTADCTRLSKTWEIVPEQDRALLRSMEALVQPVRNFHDLRAEMESSDLSDGCVPFIGKSLHAQTKLTLD